MTEQQRKVFEAWYNDEYVRPIIPADRTEGGYQHPDAQAAWDAWQAALSHAEGEAVPVAEITIDRHGDAHFKACPNYLDLDQGTYQLYTHPAPQVAGLTETAIKSSPAYRALHREKEHLLGLLKDQAPQVAVPEGFREKLEDLVAAAFYTSDMTSDKCKAGIEELMAMLAPTAPAGEPEKPRINVGSVGHVEQPVSDPDGLPEPLCYLNPKVIDWDTGKLKRGLGALTYSTDNPADNWKVPVYLSAPAPDEREIAAKALERHADNLIVMAERDGRNSDRESQQTWEEAAYFAKQEAARLRAGKEGQ